MKIDKQLLQSLPTEITAKLTGKKILVTGGCGLIGSTLVDLLLDVNEAFHTNAEITVMSRSADKAKSRFSDHASNGFLSFLTQDVCDPLPDNADFDYIVHAASLAHPLAFSQNPVDVMKANLLGTINVLECARRRPCRVVFLSTGEIYGQSQDPQKVFTESDLGLINTLQPRSCYPESKRAAETLCVSYHAQYNVDCLIARLCYVYGPAITTDNSRADAQFLRNAIDGADIVMKSRGEQVRSYCYSEDAASGLLYMMVYGQAGEAYNIANKNSTVSIRQYAQTLADLAGVHVKFEIPDDVERKGYSTVTRAVLDAQKLECLGWRPLFNLEEGLKRTIKSFSK